MQNSFEFSFGLCIICFDYCGIICKFGLLRIFCANLLGIFYFLLVLFCSRLCVDYQEF
ncbi:hypothetical protein MIMGU_mgv1a017595mg [Erythranthe guttata]|uniref:Uncharacterized protein n=1 Tax=Erythranthe guttata TaxID=4155 RepID=A0A022RFW7_ERYGU|nr:hypothetical protein MIMGU_mgv1a017595mg [Erythranthe guttata]EYU38678.1 hypothetical protein MIMGU_mgv1a017595mg [Erythranthe guttata]